MALYRFLLTVCALGMLPQLAAQPVPALGMSAGIGLGRLYNALPPAAGDFAYRVSPVCGIHARLNLLDQLDAVVECNYLQIRTVKSNTVDGGNTFTSTLVRLDYLELPLLIRRYLGDSRQLLRPYISFGPYYSRLLLTDQTRLDSSVMVRASDIGTSQGAGLQIRLRQVQLWMEGRYNMGLRNIQDKGTASLKTDLLSIRAGVCFIFP